MSEPTRRSEEQPQHAFDDASTTSAPAVPSAESPTEQTAPTPAEAPGDYAARAGSYFRNVRYVIALAMVAAGAWFLYDGFVKYPAHNERYDELTAQIEAAQAAGERERAAELSAERTEHGAPHDEFDLFLQKILGFALPPVAILLLARWLYISRGEVRLDETDTLHAPGHPPVPASAVTAMDDSRWDRKGISVITYELADGKRGHVKLDDFIYERPPIDRIHDRLKLLHANQPA